MAACTFLEWSGSEGCRGEVRREEYMGRVCRLLERAWRRKGEGGGNVASDFDTNGVEVDVNGKKSQ